MQERGPPKKVIVLAQDPGTFRATSGRSFQRSGLTFSVCSEICHRYIMRDIEYTHLNCRASAPQIAFERLMARIGICIKSPFSILVVKTDR